MSKLATIPLSEAVVLINGDRGKNYPGREEQKPSGHCLFLNTGNVQNGKWDFSELSFISEDKHQKLSGGTLQRNDIVLTIRGTLGNTAVFDESVPFATVRINSAMLALRPKPGFLAEYIERFLRSPIFTNWVGVNQRGSAQPHLRNIDIQSAQVPLLPIYKQQELVSKVDVLAATTGRANLELSRAERLLYQYREAILRSAYDGELIRLQASGRQKLTTISKLILDIRYGTSKKCSVEGRGTPVLRIPNVAGGKIGLGELKYTSFGVNELEKLRLRKGDILVVRSNGSPDLVGRAAMVSEAEAGMAFAGYLIRLRPDPKLVNPSFLKAMLGAPQVRARIEEMAKSTSGVHNINSGELCGLTIPAISLAAQAAVVARIDAAFKWLDRITSEHEQASRLVPKLNQAILAKAFRGEILDTP